MREANHDASHTLGVVWTAAPGLLAERSSRLAFPDYARQVEVGEPEPELVGELELPGRVVDLDLLLQKPLV